MGFGVGRIGVKIAIFFEVFFTPKSLRNDSFIRPIVV